MHFVGVEQSDCITHTIEIPKIRLLKWYRHKVEVEKPTEKRNRQIDQQNKELRIAHAAYVRDWESSIRQKEKEVLSQISHVDKFVNELYSAGPVCIHAKYRSIPALAAIYEFLDTGICYELEGYMGAYNRYDEEVFRKNVIDKLDNIIRQLDSIKETQHKLYTVVLDMRKNQNKISEDISRMNTTMNSIWDTVKRECESKQRFEEASLAKLENMEHLLAYNAYLNGANIHCKDISDHYRINW